MLQGRTMFLRVIHLMWERNYSALLVWCTE